VSSAILYLAIIAIWAGFLIPAWVRRPHASPAGSQSDAEHGDYAADELTVEYVTETENDVDATVGADFHVEVTQREREYRAYEYSGHEHSAQRYSGHEYLAAPHGEPGQFDHAVGTGNPDHARDGSYADYQHDDPADAYDSRDGWDEEAPSQSRQQMLRARRRMLTILVTITLVTGGFVALHVVSWWICVPPTGLLVLYVLLLREVALADAELGRKRAEWEAAQARAYRRYINAQAERDAYETAQASPGAQIIDISGRVTDQLYDQYADAAVRAVGD
jgi:hypothetical protein